MVFGDFFARRRAPPLATGHVRVEVDPVAHDITALHVEASLTVAEVDPVITAALAAFDDRTVEVRAARIDGVLAAARKAHGLTERVMGEAKRHEDEARGAVAKERFTAGGGGPLVITVDGELRTVAVQAVAAALPDDAVRAVPDVWRAAIALALARWEAAARGAVASSLPAPEAKGAPTAPSTR